jgi:hypothetical protein
MSNDARLALPQAARTASSQTIAQLADYTYPRGHLGYLSEAESEALAQFKVVLQERGYWTPGPPAPSHDDPLLLRFLRARRWVVEDAFGQFKDTEDWRKANDLDVLYKTIELDAYEECRRLYPQWTGRRDRRGIPLYVFEIKTLDHKTTSEYERSVAKSQNVSQAQTDGKTPAGLLRLFALYENLTRFNMPFSTQLVADREYSDVPITLSTNIVDISGVGLKQFWNLKSHMQAASQLATAHYPETLDRIFIIGAPMFFGTVWGWIKRWFDPITVSKIFILEQSQVKPTLEEFIHPRNIPKKYGGELDFAFGQLSVPDPEWEGVLKWENGHTSFPSGPLLWEEEEVDGSEQKRLVCVGLGSVEGKPRREIICSMPKNFELPTNATAAAAASTEQKDDVVQANGGVVTSEGTQTTETDARATAADNDTVTNGEDLSKLRLADEKVQETTVNGVPAPAQPATTAA